MMRLPGKLDPRWLSWFIIYTVLLIAALVSLRFVILDQAFEWKYGARFALLSLGISLIVHMPAWFGARWYWLCATLGIVAGLVSMIGYAGDRSGWEDLSSFLSFLMLAFAGMVVGALVQTIAWVVNATRQKRQ